ncbi:hypothetical protein GCM10025862_20190 [Arsenicicoccus piscis]|uniref:Uncharacterized protein n=1 Tax=Arsenicicoccus piscis TaxID=673954 RepID=A0ABQ6HPH4_9MICO|nr:hypothetical protein GCM10025862_20190 [Arsenicicoccus piscis]
MLRPARGADPGFLSPWLELPGLRDRAQALSDAAEVDLVTHGTTSDADTIKDTAVAQPLIVGAGLLAFSALFDADHPADAVGVGGGTRSARSPPPRSPASSATTTRCASSAPAVVRWPRPPP